MPRSVSAWGIRISACLQFCSICAMLFVLVETMTGSVGSRFLYYLENKGLVIASWTVSLIWILSVGFVFTVLFFYLDRKYRIVIQWAWFLIVIATAASFLYYLAQVWLVPGLLEWFLRMPTESFAESFYQWDQWLHLLLLRLIPSCFAVGGLIYTAAMFKSKQFPVSLCWYSLVNWSLLLLGTRVEQIFYWAIVFFVIIPWLWQIAELIRKS